MKEIARECLQYETCRGSSSRRVQRWQKPVWLSYLLVPQLSQNWILQRYLSTAKEF